MSIEKEDLHPRFEEADAIIVDHEDVKEIWPLLDHPRQTMYSEDKYTRGKLEFNLITGPGEEQPDYIEIDEPGAVTQIGYHALEGRSVLDLRDQRGGFGDALFGLAPSEEKQNSDENPE